MLDPQAETRAVSLLEIEKLSVAIGDTPILERRRPVDRGRRGDGAGRRIRLRQVDDGADRHAAAAGRGARHAAACASTASTFSRATEDQMCALRGDDIGMVFQEPMTALNPVKTIGEQVAEGIRWHTGASRREAEDRARKMLDRVGLPEAKFPLSRYPHELSGGQRQRVVIAIACALKPKLLIADEPTTALDVVLQKQILELLRDLVDENRMGAAADLARSRRGRRHGRPHHHPARRRGDGGRRDGKDAVGSSTIPTRASWRRPRCMCRRAPAIAATHARRSRCSRSTTCRASIPAGGCRCSGRGQPVAAVDDVSFSHQARPVDRAGRPFRLREVDARPHRAGARPADFGHDPLPRRDADRQGRFGAAGARGATCRWSSRTPTARSIRATRSSGWSPSRCICSTRKPDAAERRELVVAALHEVGLKPEDIDKYPHEFSGGQRQRLSIARALITRPKLIVADEPVSALDVSIRAQILDLFADLNDRLGVAYLFITHDLTVARAITDDVMVMDEGRIVETGSDGRRARPSALGRRQGAGRRRARPAPGDRAAVAGTGLIETRQDRAGYVRQDAPRRHHGNPSTCRRTGIDCQRARALAKLHRTRFWFAANSFWSKRDPVMGSTSNVGSNRRTSRDFVVDRCRRTGSAARRPGSPFSSTRSRNATWSTRRTAISGRG